MRMEKNQEKNMGFKTKFKKILIKNIKGIWNVFPILISIMLLISLIDTIVPKDFYTHIFTNYELINAFIMDFVGSILAGNTLTAYILGLNLLENGISLFIITTFILAWTTVGVIQFPAESFLMGKKFAIIRNVLSFIFAILVSFITVIIYGVLS